MLFIGSGGTIAFERLYAPAGLLRFSMNAQHKLSAWSAGVPNWIWLLALIVGIVAAFVVRRRANAD